LLNTSKITDLYQAFAQQFSYKEALHKLEPDRIFALAIPDSIYDNQCGEIMMEELLEEYPVKLIIYSPYREEIESWIN